MILMKQPRSVRKERREKNIEEQIGNYCLSIKNADNKTVTILTIFKELNIKVKLRFQGAVFVKKEVERFVKEDLKWKEPLKILNDEDYHEKLRNEARSGCRKNR